MMRSGQEPAVQRAPNQEPLPTWDAPIGIFDSGIGGLTVAREVMRSLPNEQIIYIGDTARVPYGTKSDRTIKAFTLQSCLFLLEHGVKMIIIGCNTSSAVALDFIADMFRIPVIGVIRPGARAAVQKTVRKKIGVIGTHTTIRTEAYTRGIHELDPNASVISQACPLFVPLAEEGWSHHDVTDHVVREYLNHFKGTDIDTLVMGCTHYPIMQEAIQRVSDEILGHHVMLIDSGVETAKLAQTILIDRKIETHRHERPKHCFYVTDLPKNFTQVAERFLGSPIDHLEVVNVETLGF
jgi:glutamate racemase